MSNKHFKNKTKIPYFIELGSLVWIILTVFKDIFSVYFLEKDDSFPIPLHFLLISICEDLQQ